MKRVFIVNPTSGQERAIKIAGIIKELCEEEKIEYEMRYTTQPDEATWIAREYKKDNAIIYAVGGDGTLNEVLNGIVGTKNMLGVIPAGSGNDFYKVLKNIDEEFITIDIGKLNHKYFLNIASIGGIDAEVGYYATLMKRKKIPSSQIYHASILYTFFKFKYKKLELTLNNAKEEGQYTIVTICNGQYYGNGFHIAPNAKLNDGVFDIYFADKINKVEIPHLLLKLKKGTHEKSAHVHKKEATKIRIKSDKDIICNYDGEIMIDKNIKIQLCAKALTIYNDKELVNKILEREKNF